MLRGSYGFRPDVFATSQSRLKVSLADAQVRGTAAVAVTAMLGLKVNPTH